MNKILEDLKAVPGVYGALFLNKSEETTYQLLPAFFSSEAIRSIALRLLQVTYYLKPGDRLSFDFAYGSVILQNLEKAALLVFTKGELETDIFDMVLRNSIKALERRLERYEQVREKLSSEALLSDEEAVLHFLSAANLVTAHFKPILGVYRLTQNWRKARESLAGDFSFHHRLFVDSNATLSFKNSNERISVATLTDFFARLLHGFLKFSVRGTVEEVSVEKLTSEVRQSLEKTNFYRSFALLEKR